MESNARVVSADSGWRETIISPSGKKVIRVRIFYGELCFWISFQVAPLVTDVENKLVALGDNLRAGI
jgi:hypothetical protein